MTDVPRGSVAGLRYKPTLHVHYGEKVLAVRDGLPKFKDFPKDFGGSGETLPDEAAVSAIEGARVIQELVAVESLPRDQGGPGRVAHLVRVALRPPGSPFC